MLLKQGFQCAARPPRSRPALLPRHTKADSQLARSPGSIEVGIWAGLDAGTGEFRSPTKCAKTLTQIQRLSRVPTQNSGRGWRQGFEREQIVAIATDLASDPGNPWVRIGPGREQTTVDLPKPPATWQPKTCLREPLA